MMGLKPCPFCGTTPSREIRNNILSVQCNECVSIGFHNHVNYGTVADTEWNTRATDPLLKEMAEALEEIVRCLSHGLQDCRASIIAKEMLQKYHELESTQC